MCGFAGYLASHAVGCSANSVTSLTTNAKKNALHTIKRRGPDAEAEWQDQHLWLGHRRLSVMDPGERGTQPLERKGYVIAFNGMIYNYRDIREKLIDKGYKFTTDTDTEVVILGWVEWGEALLPRLRGMFAFALWDKVRKVLFLVRDRLGKKPLYFRDWSGNIAFGSRLDAVEALTEPAKLSNDALSWLMTLKYLPDPFCAADGVQKVPSGHLIKFEAGKQKLKRWYSFQPDPESRNISLQDQQRKLYSLMETAVAERLISDVPIACFLSGGIDSAIVAALARKHGPIDTFTASFDETLIDESRIAQNTSKFLGTNHHEIRLKSDEQLDLVDQLFNTALDEPFGDSSALPSLFVSKAMKGYATVALSGDGADELFGGYRKYQGEIAVNTWQRLPQPVRLALTIIINQLPTGHTNSITDKFRQFRRFVDGAKLDTLQRHAFWMEAASSSPDIQKAITFSKHQQVIKMLKNVKIPQGLDTLSATLLRDLETVLISDMLVKIDRTSMDNGLEVRSPFLDHRVAEMALAIDGKEKIVWGQGKKILRDIFKNDLPENLLRMPKKGFEMPLNNWLAGPLNSELKKALAPEFMSYNQLNPQLGKILNKGIKKGQLPHAELGWTLISIYRWQQTRGFI